MVVKFNYTYYTTPDESTQYIYTFDQPVYYQLAHTLSDVGNVVDCAETYQKEGYYVALYLPYEAASFYNDNFETYEPADGLYAAFYAFDQPVTEAVSVEGAYEMTIPTFTCTNTQEEIKQHIRTIHKEITEGWTYQVNYTTRFESHQVVPISRLYAYLTQKGNGHYTVLMDTEVLQIASISPELFFQVGQFDTDQQRTIVSKPMKGTMPRGKTKAEDDHHFNMLKQSAKDQAENVMIVDLLRNDIARIAQTGTVKVDHLFNIETYDTVFQMTTMVSGKIDKTISYNQLFTALFPCGSITGAPKINTMRIIHRLENTPRHSYCGTIGLLHPNGNAVFNVPIRTLQQINDKMVYGVGAGITIDSDPQAEYEEFLTKTKILEG